MKIHDPDFGQSVSYRWHLGNCFTKSGDGSGLIYVHIPKNASEFTRGKLTATGFVEINYHQHQRYHSPVLVALRDPMDRWITGAVEFLVRKYTEPVQAVQRNEESDLYDSFDVDEHTARQTKFLHGLDTDLITFLHVDHKYEDNLTYFFAHAQNIILSDQDVWRNESAESLDKAMVRNLILKKINQLHRERLMQYLKPDYDLLESVKFYDPI